MAAAVKHAKVVGNSPRADQKHLNIPGSEGKGPSLADRRLSTRADDAHTPAPENLNRRRSTFKGVAANFMFVRRMTKASMDKEAAAAAVAAAAAAKPKVRLENTFQLGPKEEQQFHCSKAEKAVQEILDTTLANQTYNAGSASTLVAMLSERVKAAVKGMHTERHKLVTNVIVGPVSNQGMVVASRCVWDTSTDTVSTVNFNNGKIFAIVNVYAVYYE